MDLASCKTQTQTTSNVTTLSATLQHMNLHERIDLCWKKGITILEKIVAFGVIIGVLAYSVHSTGVLLEMNWATTATYYELITRVLGIIIGLELVRMLVSHSIAAVLELLAFVIARKMLTPDLDSLDIVAGVAAFVALMAARHFFTESGFLDEENTRDVHKSHK